MLIALCYYVCRSKDSLIVLLSMFSLCLINSLNLNYLNEDLYILKAVVEMVFINIGISINIKPSIIIIFFVSLIYNILSFIEFNTQQNLIYNAHYWVISFLLLSLIYIIFTDCLINIKQGIKCKLN